VIQYRAGKISSIHSVALTNHPATHGCEPLVAASDDETDSPTEKQKQETRNMENLKKVAEKLGMTLALADEMPEDAKEASLMSVMAKLDELMKQIETLKGLMKAEEVETVEALGDKMKKDKEEKLAMSDTVQSMKAEKLVLSALDSGKISKAQEAWAMGYAKNSLESFSDFLSSAPVVVPGSAPKVDQITKDETIQLSDIEAEVFKNMGLKSDVIEQIKKQKKGK
jgi:phage I-like protein